MTNTQAINIAEGWTDPSDESEYFEAWQHLIDTGLAWKLQGWFGRTAIRLIEAGVVKIKNQA